ncbi:hypothetical protein [Candidatus Uabimicrobium sp. HlEnr_7]|uniref:hypothetical protein n=1 Tax=Candidatus Uabimicrobium helgolandensis TaxID=3095367 RepID=UPI0035578FA7
MTENNQFICIIIMTFSIIHCLSGVAVRDMPAWKMFKNVDRYEYLLVDCNGQKINIRDYLPHRAYSINQCSVVTKIAKWWATKNPQRLPLQGKIKIWKFDRWNEHHFRINKQEIQWY